MEMGKGHELETLSGWGLDKIRGRSDAYNRCSRAAEAFDRGCRGWKLRG